MNTFDRRYEMMARPELEQLQLERLQALLVRLKRHVRRYREQLADRRVEALPELERLPMTSPEDLAASFPYGMFALPLREVIRLCSVVGPEGQPLVLGHTRNDQSQWGRLVARQLVACGITANDVIQVSLGGAGAGASGGYLLGAEVIEASVIADDPFHIDYQLAMLQNYRPTVLITTPVNADALMRLIEARRIDPQSLHLRTVLLSRPVDKEERERIRAGLFAAVRCNMGIDEVLNPGFSVECDEGRFHVNEDQFLVEEKEGELLVTSLAREAMPLLRFRTRLACQISRIRCACGRTGASLMPGKRLDNRWRVNEAVLYESQVAAVLAQTQAAGHAFRIQVQEQKMILAVQMTPDLFADTIWPIERLRRQIESEFLARLGIETEVRFVVGPP